MKLTTAPYSLLHPGVRFSFMFVISAFRSCVLSLRFQTFAQLTTLKVMREIQGPLNSPLMKRPGSFNVGQCSRCSRGRPHRRVALYFVAEIANWLPEVNISPHAPTSHSEYSVLRSDTMINKLVSVHVDGIVFHERRRCLDPVQYQHRSFDQVSELRNPMEENC